MGAGHFESPGLRPGPRHWKAESDEPVPAGAKGFIDYPRAGKRGFKRWIPSWRQMLAISGASALLLLGGVTVAYALTEVPEIEASQNQQPSTVYYADGKTVLGTFRAEGGTQVDLDLADISVNMQNAAISAEDRTFKENTGISYTGLLRAVWSTASGSQVQGGSTITQQYVKLVILQDSSRTVQRKVKEFFIALKLTKERDKDYIMEHYLNATYYGRGATGIQSASQAYFGVDAKDLTVSQAAFLASCLQDPNDSDYVADPSVEDHMRDRWTYVVKGMYEDLGAISQEEYEAAEFPELKSSSTTSSDSDDSASDLASTQSIYLKKMVEKELTDDSEGDPIIEESDLSTGGYKIVTTFQEKKVEQAVKSVKEALGAKKTWKSGTQAALISLNNETGAVEALYGGDGTTRYTSTVSQDYVQAGSTYKPYTLIAALEGGEDGDPEPLSLKSEFSAAHSYTTDSGYKFLNYGTEAWSSLNLIEATMHSANTVFGRLNVRVGAQATVDVAAESGVTMDEKSGCSQANIANVLGTCSPHVADMAEGYMTIASGGMHKDAYSVQTVTTALGGELYEHEVDETRVYDEEVADNATYAMESVVSDDGTGSYAQNLGRPVAGKTGTTNDNISAWFIGFTPQTTTAVSLFRLSGENFDTSESLVGWGSHAGDEITGGTFPTELWTTYMKKATKGVEVKSFADPTYSGEEVGVTASATATATQTETKSTTTTTTTTTQATQSPTETNTWTQDPDPSTTDPTATTTTTDPTLPTATTSTTRTRADSS